MKRVILLGWLTLFLAPMAWGQEKVEAPVWNVGDKWVFSGGGTIEVLKVEQNGIVVKFSEDICVLESQGIHTIIFEKSTLNRLYTLAGDKRKKYTRGLKKILNFPLGTGKEWKSAYSSTPLFGFFGGAGRFVEDYSESYTIQGWENVEIRAGKFKALRLKYKRLTTGCSHPMQVGIGIEVKNQYWYSPAVKYFVKCEYDKNWIKGEKGIFNWELTSLQPKK
jgi:hypothetical protein